MKKRIASVIGATVLAAGLQAGTMTTAEAYDQTCTDIGNGTLCIDANGVAGSHGYIGVAYIKREGAPVRVYLAWQSYSNDPGGPTRAPISPGFDVAAGQSTGSQVWPTYLGEGTVAPILYTAGSGTPIYGDTVRVH